MNDKRLWIAALTLSIIAILVFLVSNRPIVAQPRPQHREQNQLAPVYSPYPPGILPSNLDPELARVLREVDVLENRAMARWHDLGPAALTGQPPVLQNIGTEAVETLGELMLYDGWFGCNPG